LQVLSGTESITGESANATWITLQDNVSSTVWVWVTIELVKMTFGSSTGFVGIGFIFIQENSTGDYIGDSVVSNFTGAFSFHLTELESAYGALATVNEGNSNSSIKAFGYAEAVGVDALELLAGHAPSWLLSYSVYGVGTSMPMMPANIADGEGGGCRDCGVPAFDNADCWSELLLFGLATAVLLAEISACIASGGLSCIIVYITINLLPIPEAIAILDACGL
jgi:hypothetical protein